MVIDRVGFLSELYGACHLAFVGGALHHKVHNVLEPLCYGLPIAFGPRYHTSPRGGRIGKIWPCHGSPQYRRLVGLVEKERTKDQ